MYETIYHLDKYLLNLLHCLIILPPCNHICWANPQMYCNFQGKLKMYQNLPDKPPNELKLPGKVENVPQISRTSLQMY